MQDILTSTAGVKETSPDFRGEGKARRERLRILFLSHRLPYPPLSGGAIKRWKVAVYLAGNYDLSVAVLSAPEDLPHREAFLRLVNPVHFSATLIHRPRNALNLFRSWLTGLPLAVYRNDSPVFRAEVEKASRSADVLYLDSLLVLPALPEAFRGKIVLHAHNAEYVIWKRYAAREKNPLRRAAVLLEAGRMRRYEALACRRADRILAAPNDQVFLRRLGVNPAKWVDTSHLGDETLLDLPDIAFRGTEPALLHVGSLDWEPNLDGLVWFLREVWDGLKERHPQLRFYILGRGGGRRLSEAARGRPGVLMPGFVPDLEPYHRRCRLFVAPVRFGGGMKVKIINAMYRGIPVLTTPVGAEGLEVMDRRHLSISSDAAKMLRDADHLLKDAGAWERMRDASRRHARERFDWGGVYGSLRSAIER